MNSILRSVLRIAAALAAIGSAATPAAAQVPTQIQFLDSTMHLMTQSGMRATPLRIRTLDSMGMPAPNASVHLAYSPECGNNPMPFDIMTDAMGMGMTPEFMTPAGYGACIVTLELLPAMVRQTYIIDVYNLADIRVMQVPGAMIDAVADNMFQFAIMASVHGNPLVNALTTFSVMSPGMANVSMLMPMAAMTDSMGSVMASAMANSMTGSYQINARVDGAMAIFVVNQVARNMMPPPPPVQVTAQSGASPAGSGPITVSLLGSSCAFSVMRVMSMQDAALPSPPSGIAFPHGVVSMRVENCGMGQSVNVAIDYPEQVPPTAAFWRYGPTADSLSPHWYRVPATIENHRLQLMLTDGMMGDDDMMMNGSRCQASLETARSAACRFAGDGYQRSLCPS